jgi:N-acetylglucosamine malate deacetylase 1
MSYNVVIISAHPDDMEIGMGGTVAKLVDSMAEITSVVVTNGGRSSNPFALTEQRVADVRREEALCAAGILGVKEVIFCDEPDAAEEINTTSVARRLVGILARLRPTEVYTLDEELDRHPAHRLAGKLARESVLEAGIVLSGGIWAYEIWGLFATWAALSTSTATWPRRWPPSRSIIVRWQRYPMGKESWD